MKNCFTILFVLGLFVACSQDNKHGVAPSFTNKLVEESSPYLLQHAHNPVNWYPWKAEALAKAKAENKMLIISIGYSACHWCHVMEHESFEDTTVARIMNEHFISIKVDREERPDVDNVYMNACHLASGKSCGWPLNAFALPDGRPVWAGTYFPKKNWLEILEYFQKLHQNDPDQLEEYATKLTEGVNELDKVAFNTEQKILNTEELAGLTKRFLSNIDLKRGGRKGAPKFPMPNNYSFLLKYHFQKQDQATMEAVSTTLEQMAYGGIYDQLGGGFARYSTDANWHVPHFEKMLYDNAQLVELYAQAYQLTQKPLYESIVEESLTFVDDALTSTEGGFYSSLDADSEGEEGKFYVWQQDEIEAILADDRISKIFCDYYEVSTKGNWEEVNILHRKDSKSEIAEKYNLDVPELEKLLSKAKAKLLEARAKRIPPGLDDKILTAWNALMINGYIEAYKAFGKEAYLDKAIKAANFIRTKMLQPDYRLNRNYKSKQSVINAFLDDYAQSIRAFAALYEVTFDESWLDLAKNLTEYTLEHFYDKEKQFFQYTSKIDPPLIAANMETSDNVIPGSNSTMARNLYKLGLFYYDENYTAIAQQMLQNIIGEIDSAANPSFYSNWLHLYLDLLQPPYEVAIVGDNFSSKLKALQRNYLPNAIFLGGRTEGTLSLLENKLQEGETMIYVCQDRICQLPVTQAELALSQIKP